MQCPDCFTQCLSDTCRTCGWAKPTPILAPPMRAYVPPPPGVPMPPEVRERIDALVGTKDMAAANKPVVDFSVLGCRARCQHCQQYDQIQVCWCKKDLCGSCLSAHAPQCKRLQAVQKAF